MKKNYFLVAILSFVMVSMNAQFTDDLESYAAGDPIYGGHWTDWACGGTCALVASNTYAHDGAISGLVPGDEATDGVLDLGNKIFGQWGLEFYAYIPSGKRGYYNVQGTIPIGSGEWAMGNIFFNDGDENVGPGNGYFDLGPATDPADHVQFTYPEDTWFSIIMNVDISLGIGASTVQIAIDGTEVIVAGTPFADFDGTYPTSLGGLDLWSNGPDNEMYFDTFNYQDSFISLGTQSFEATGFRSALNNNILSLRANEEISNVSIYNMLGQEVYRSSSNTSEINMSSYANGTYIVKVNVAGTEGTVKIVK